jgi:PAS domain S-box-containing protein
LYSKRRQAATGPPLMEGGRDSDAAGSLAPLRSLISQEFTDVVTDNLPAERLQYDTFHQACLDDFPAELRRTHVELEESRTNFSSLYYFAPVGYLTLTEEDVISELNLAAAQLLGIERGRARHRLFFRFVQPESRDTVYLHKREVLKTGTKQTCEFQLKREDGVPMDARLESIAMDMAGKRVILSVLTDITERKQAEEAVHRQNAILEAINEVLNAGLTCDTEEDLGHACLEVAERLTQSRFGFIGDVNEEGLEDIAVSNPGWDECAALNGRRRPAEQVFKVRSNIPNYSLHRLQLFPTGQLYPFSRSRG